MRRKHLPPPLSIPWLCKPVDSARSTIDVLDDGRLHICIRHAPLRGVTPDMLLWWFQNLEGDMDFAGQVLPRYRVWHPRDHIANKYLKRLPDGTIGPGAQLYIEEVFGRDPRYAIKAASTITRLDRGGFEHRPRRFGLPVAVMTYRFSACREGTLYVNSITIGLRGLPGRLFNRLIRKWIFDEAHGRAWVRHNVEEVGNFESFLPALYASRH